jgi:hypothetical protein
VAVSDPPYFADNSADARLRKRQRSACEWLDPLMPTGVSVIIQVPCRQRSFAYIDLFGGTKQVSKVILLLYLSCVQESTYCRLPNIRFLVCSPEWLGASASPPMRQYPLACDDHQ